MYPALAVLQEQKSKENVDEILWVGGAEGIEKRLVEREGVPFRGIAAAGLHGVGLKKLPGNLLRLIHGFFESLAIVRDFNPDVLFFTGGYVGFPVALAGLFRRKVIFIPDIEPAVALSALSKVADRITVVAEESRRYLPKRAKVTVTGYPTRPGLTAIRREDALAKFGLDPELPTVFFFGGSKGAASINIALWKILPQLCEHAQVLHATGEANWGDAQTKLETLPETIRGRYHAYPYLHETIGAAFRAADLIVSRAGASTIGEFPLFAVPAILVPYPHAWRYQRINAEYLVSKGAARLLRDEELTDGLLPNVLAVLTDAEERERMSAAMRSLAKPDAAGAIAGILLEAGGKTNKKRKK